MNPCARHVNPIQRERIAERRLHWILGICLGLVIGYVWGQFDAHHIPTMTQHEAQP